MLPRLRIMRGWPLWVRLIGATGALIAAFAFQIPLETEVPGEPFLLFFLIVVATTLTFGEGVGLFAVGLSTLLSVYFFEPFDTLALRHAADLVKIELYALIAGGSVLGFAHLARASLSAYETTLTLAQAEKRKSVLLREVAHRVANNFATVAILMRRKAALVSDAAAKSVLDEAVDQVGVMARVHRRLHAGGENVTLDSERFIVDLCADLEASMAQGRSVSITCAAVSRPLPLAQAVPLGLVVNELMTNAIKYAFPDGRPGNIDVNLEESGDQLCLTVEDDGVGVAAGSRTGLGGGLGQDLLVQLACQLGGHLEVVPKDHGSAFRLRIACASVVRPAATVAQPASLLH